MASSVAQTPATDEEQLKRRTASVSVLANCGLILLKVIAGTITGSVAILTDAVHSSIDLVASIVAYISVRKAGEPADESHRYGHEKIENLAAAIEGILILIGSAAIAFAAVRRLLGHGRLHSVGLGIAVVTFSMLVTLSVSALLARNARQTESPALEGDAVHLRTDAISSGAVLVSLALVQLTGAQWLDPAVALLVSFLIVFTGVRLMARSARVLVDHALPADEVEAIRRAIKAFAPRGVVGYHELRTRRAGARRYVDLHVQFRAGTSLEAAHGIAHELQDRIAARLDHTDVLIHLEPEDRVRPGEVLVKHVDAGPHAESDRPAAGEGAPGRVGGSPVRPG